MGQTYPDGREEEVCELLHVLAAVHVLVEPLVLDLLHLQLQAAQNALLLLSEELEVLPDLLVVLSAQGIEGIHFSV